MVRLHRPRPKASRAERLSDAFVHYVALLAALIAVPVLVTAAVSRRGDWVTVTSVSVYGACLLAMLVCSALYNIVVSDRWDKVLKRLDHSAIYLKIAGTWTPFVAMTGAGLPLLAGLWGAALGGTSLKVIAPDRLRWLSIVLYLAMGWVGVLVGADVLGGLSPPAVALVMAGGLIYTAGVVFFLWESLPFHTAIWHLFVVIGSAFLYAAILIEVLREIDIPMTT